LLFILRVPLVSYERHFNVLGILGWASRRFMIDFYLFPAASLLAFSPFFPLNGYNPLLVQYTRESQKVRRRKGKGVKNDKYD